MPSRNWVRPFLKLAQDVGLEFESLSDAVEALRQFLEPVLDTEANIKWNPSNWHWE